MIKPTLLDHLQCSQCAGRLAYQAEGSLFICSECGQAVAARDQKPIYTPPPADIVPYAKLRRGPHIGTPWRRSNWRFLQEQLSRLDSRAVILDVGTGQGEFTDLFEGHNYLALDVYPYPEVDIVCDLTLVNPFKPESFEAILLLNVLEHIYDTRAMLSTLSSLLKPGGILILAIPFMVKIHQAPIDFVRYTHFALEALGKEHGLWVEQMEGFYDPISLLGEGIGNLKYSVLPGLSGFRHYLGRLLLLGIQALATGLQSLLGAGKAKAPEQARSQAPTGYQIVYRKGP